MGVFQPARGIATASRLHNTGNNIVGMALGYHREHRILGNHHKAYPWAMISDKPISDQI